MRRSFTRKEVNHATQDVEGQKETRVPTPLAQEPVPDALGKYRRPVLVLDGLGHRPVDSGPGRHHLRYVLLDGRDEAEQCDPKIRTPRVG